MAVEVPVVLVVLSQGLPALAHEALQEPIPRYPSDGSSNIKSCPCGVGPNDQLCSVEGARSDPNRAADRVTTYASGETITVRLLEAIGHSGRWRIAFDPDGADLADFDANVLLDVPDPPGSEGNVGQGNLWEFVVTLPNVGCDTCTLQVIQVMNGDTDHPVLDPVGQSSYYQCADLELVGAPPDTGSDIVPDTDPPDTEPPDTDVATTPTVPEPADTGADPAEGCGCSGGAAWAAPWWALVLVPRRRTRR